MTAYGRNLITTKDGRFSIEIHSVNRRNLDINIYLPRELLFLDMEIRKLVSKEVKRGGIHLRVTKEIDPQNMEQTLPNVQALIELKNRWEKVALNLHFDPKKEISLGFILEQLNRQGFSMPIEDEERIKQEIEEGLRGALRHFLEMKEEEGNSLLTDIHQRIQLIRELTNEIQKGAKEPEERYKSRLIEKLKEIQELNANDEERLHREMIFFAEKIDITEELTRIFSHLDQFEKYIESKEKSIGKTLDFLIQELNRETNTVNAKTPDANISQIALRIKAELEKIREQLQNIE